MFVRIYWGKLHPESWPAVEERYRALMDEEAPGLLARVVSRDVDDPDSMFTITVWQDRKSVEAWERSAAYRDVFLAALRPFLVGSQSVSLCEVRVADMERLAALVSAAR